MFVLTGTSLEKHGDYVKQRWSTVRPIWHIFVLDKTVGRILTEITEFDTLNVFGNKTLPTLINKIVFQRKHLKLLL